MKKYLFLIFLFIFSFIFASEQNKELDLEKSINLLLIQNLGIAESKENLASEKATYNKAKSVYYPSLSLSSSYSYSKTKLSENSSTGAAASLSWTVFAFGANQNLIRQAWESVKSSDINHKIVIRNNLYSLIKAYYNYLDSKENLEKTLEIVEAAKLNYQISQEKFNLGMITKKELLTSETSYYQEILSKQKLEATEKENYFSLLNLLNIPLNEKINFAYLDNSQIVIKEKSDSSLIPQALGNNLELKKLKISNSINKYSYKYQTQSNLPKISLSAKNSWDKDDDAFSQSLSISASIPIFSGFETYYTKKKIKSSINVINYQIRQKEEEIKKNIKTKYENLLVAKLNFEITTKSLETAQENKNIYVESYKLGKVGIYDLKQALSDLATSYKNHISSKYDFFIAQAELNKELGLLQEK